MWCRVQVCRGPSGERRKREQWDAPILGKLSIFRAQRGITATLEKRDGGRQVQLLYPLFDVRVMTWDGGFLVIGYAIHADFPGKVVRECRQAWYCVPMAI